MESIYKVLVVDDHPIVCEGMVSMLNQQPNLKVVGSAHNGKEAQVIFRKWKPDVVLLDVDMPEMDGLSLAKWLREQYDNVHIILFTNHLKKKDISTINNLEIKGVVLKQNASKEVIVCLNNLIEGNIYYGEGVSELMKDVKSCEATSETSALSTTEREILRLIAQGYSSKKIAEQLGRSVRTVEKHRSNICTKLNIHEKNGLLYYVVEHAGEI